VTGNSTYSLRLTLVGLCLLLLMGAYLRLLDLDARSITHPEMWVPGIRMPEGISEPRQRLTLWKVLTGTFSSDTHPPGFYLLMWAWTKCFGTSIWSIRLPAALMGFACIPLVFWLATITGQCTARWVAAALLAVNGFHVFWSKVARMYSMACFLGLLATVLLLLLAREKRPRQSLLIAYTLVILLGLSAHIFFWSVFFTHMLWTFLNAWHTKQPLPCLCRLQILTLILASPLLAFAAYQSASPLTPLSNNVFLYAREFVQFSFLFPLEGVTKGLFPWFYPYSPSQGPQFWIGRGPLMLFSTFLVVLGMTSVGQRREVLLTGHCGLSRKLWFAVAGLASLAILIFILMARALVDRPNATLKITKLLTILPLLLAVVGSLLEATWETVANRGQRLAGSRFVVGSQALVNMMAVVPFALLSLISFFKPILNHRGLLFATPYILLVLAGGIVSLARRGWLAVCLFIILVILHASSVMAYKGMKTEADFKTFAAALAPHIQRTDLVFLQPKWLGTPILYYLTADRYRLVGNNFREACHQNPNARVWTLFFYDQEMSREMSEALADYQVVERIEMSDARAILYSPSKTN